MSIAILITYLVCHLFNACYIFVIGVLTFDCFFRQKDMINISASDHVEMESNNQGHAHLTLKNVKPSDNGLYYCVAHSKAGRAKCTAYLHVKGQLSSLYYLHRTRLKRP